MFDCKHCGTPTVRQTTDQRYCRSCEARVKALIAPPPTPAFEPPWRRYAKDKDLTHLVLG